MTNVQDFTKFFANIPTEFTVDPKVAGDAWKIWANFGEGFSGIALQAATKSNEIAVASTREALSRFRDISKVREEPTEYAQAFSDFAQAQLDNSRRVAEAFGDVVQQAQTKATDLVTTTADRFAQTGVAVAPATRKTPAKRTPVSKAAR